MNTNLSSGSSAIKPPIQLKARYERLTQADKDGLTTRNAAITAQAEQQCGAQFPGEGFNAPRVECIQQFVSANAVNEASAIPDELYKFDFVSPKWSPDLAGISLAVSVLCFVLFATRLVVDRLIRHRLH